MKTINFILLLIICSITGFSQNYADNYFNHNFIFKDIPLNKQQQEMLVEINENNKDLKKLYQTRDSINVALKELYDIKKISKNFSDIYKRTVKKINFLEYELTEVEYDIEYYKENNYNLTYKIYEIAINNKNIAKSVKKQEIKEKILESEKYASKVNNIIDKLDDVSDNEDVKYLKDANKYAELAIKSQEKALAECYHFTLKDDIYYAENTQTEKETKTESTSNDTKIKTTTENETNTQNLTADISNTSTKNTKSSDIQKPDKKDLLAIANNNEIIIFKIQIGAFINDVTNDKFNNLDNISIDTTDELDFTKVMTGSFTCYQDALKAREDIIKTTEYKDAFVVAYSNSGKRIPLEVALGKSLQNSNFITQN